MWPSCKELKILKDNLFHRFNLVHIYKSFHSCYMQALFLYTSTTRGSFDDTRKLIKSICCSVST